MDSSSRKQTQAKSQRLRFGQRLAIAGTQMVMGTLTGVIRLFRGSHPPGWRTLRYGLHRDEVLDHMSPATPVDARAPIVFFHGGGWMMGTKDFYSHDLLFLAQEGYPVFNVEYPKAPDHPHPWLLRSIFKALLFIRASFPEARAVHLMGDSAGGNLAVMAGILAQNPELLAVVDPEVSANDLPAIVSTTSLYGIMDRETCLQPHVPVGTTMIEAYGGPGALEAQIGPEHAITPMDLLFARHPPCLLSCGAWDPLCAANEMYAKRLTDEGHSATLKVYEKATHGYFNFPESGAKPVCRRDILAFLRSVEGGTDA